MVSARYIEIDVKVARFSELKKKRLKKKKKSKNKNIYHFLSTYEVSRLHLVEYMGILT